MKQMKKYLFRLVAFLGLTITPFIASAEEVSLGESISKFLNDTGFARLVEGNWLCLVMIAVACLLFYLAIVKKFEPLLLLPIAFGMLLTNLPGAGLYHPELFEGGHIHWPDFIERNLRYHENLHETLCELPLYASIGGGCDPSERTGTGGGYRTHRYQNLFPCGSRA